MMRKKIKVIFFLNNKNQKKAKDFTVPLQVKLKINFIYIIKIKFIFFKGGFSAGWRNTCGSKEGY